MTKRLKEISFKQSQYSRAINLIRGSNIFNGDIGNGIFRGKKYPFVLQNAENNLNAQYKDAILAYFTNNKIAWWNGKLTNHALSSQVACINHLFPVRENKHAILSIIKQIEPDIVDVLPITSDKYMPAYIQFEAVSDTDHLNETISKRGSNCTSIDALIYGVHKDGRKILFPIEWKYVETYNNQNKGIGDRGAVRKSRYTDLINNSAQLKANLHDVYYFEPFYQLMRQTLWAEQMITHKMSETIKADDYIHVHVIPNENKELLDKIYPCSNKGMKATWQRCLNEGNKYVIINYKDLFSNINRHQFATLIEYLQLRYW